ncbi:MAG: hypothetical protein IIC61_15165 [Proteobacteria bacterium]|nr:hypothetical protein [Pseudomonadota bacterium]
MNEWLAIMPGEIDRKKREAAEAKDQSARRSGEQDRSEQQTEKKSDSGQDLPRIGGHI